MLVKIQDVDLFKDIVYNFFKILNTDHQIIISINKPFYDKFRQKTYAD